ncbi:MAG: nucleoside hydrolase [Pirellulales bacterium]
MARKVIIDCDPGIDDAVALMIALFDPRLEVVAVTSTAGNVSAEKASRNLQALIEHLDPPRRPRIGIGSGPLMAPPVDVSHLNGHEGLGNVNLAVSSLHQKHVAEKIIIDEIRAAPDQVTILALGPLTNIARVLQRDPMIAPQIGQLVIRGGSVSCVGDVTPAAEFNCYFDPQAAKDVFLSKTTKTLIPLEIAQRVRFTIDLLDELPRQESKAGQLLHEMLPFAFRSYRQELGIEGIYLKDVIALVALLQPELFSTTAKAGNVETSGEITNGVTVFDRRISRDWKLNMDVATSVEVSAAKDCVIRGMMAAIRAS